MIGITGSNNDKHVFCSTTTSADDDDDADDDDNDNGSRRCNNDNTHTYYELQQCVRFSTTRQRKPFTLSSSLIRSYTPS